MHPWKGIEEIVDAFVSRFRSFRMEGDYKDYKESL